MAPQQHKALLLQERNGPFFVDHTETPKPGPGEILVRIEATALNPADWKIRKYGFFIEKYPAIIGSDGAGVVTELGEGVTNLVTGDKVVYNGLPRNKNACFQQYGVVPASVAAKIPSNITFDQASTLSVALAAASVGLYYTQGPSGGAGLAAPWEGGEGKYAGQPIFVFGGSSSVGQYTIQLAKFSGFSPIITTASLEHTEYLKSIGATHVIDRKHPLSNLAAQVKEITDKPFNIVYDAISVSSTQNAGYDLLAPGGWLVVVTGVAVDERKRVANKHIANPAANFQLGYKEFGALLYSNLTKLLELGVIKPNRLEVIGGLADIPKGLQRLEAGQVSGIKLVAHPQE